MENEPKKRGKAGESRGRSNLGKEEEEEKEEKKVMEEDEEKK